MSKKENKAVPSQEKQDRNEQYSLNDDRRVKVLSPGALVAKRFFRNRLAVTGMIVLVAMFAFSFLGGVISPYQQDQKFYRTDIQTKDFAGVLHNEDLRYIAAESGKFTSAVQAQTLLAMQRISKNFAEVTRSDGLHFLAAKDGSLSADVQMQARVSIGLDRTEFAFPEEEIYSIEKISDRLYLISKDEDVLGLFAEDFVVSASSSASVPFAFARDALTAKERGEATFVHEGKTYAIDADGSIKDETGAAAASFSMYSVSPAGSDVVLTPEITDRLVRAIEANEEEFEYDGANYVFSHGASTSVWAVTREDPGAADTFSYRDVEYRLKKIGRDFFCIYTDDELIGIAVKKLVNGSSSNVSLPFEFTYNALVADVSGERSFSSEDRNYTIDDDGVVYEESGEEVAYISEYIVRAVMGDVFLSRDFKNQLIDAIEAGEEEFRYTDASGKETEYALRYNASTKAWDVKQETDTTVFDTYAEPTKAHPLGTDRNGMDMLTRLMYGGRVSLIIGFIVVFIESILGVIMGGISGYFGGWVDNLIMRIVDILYCIPSLPIIIIIGAAMDAANLDPSIRMLYLMLILGVLGWPGIARLVRGQILSLREQEFMTATEAGGISVSRRIFKHLIPNVIPQLIVTMTMGLGSTIILEATLSFLGLGVRFPFASWGNIINDVNNVFVLTHYWNIWIPAGVLLLLTVLAFNIVGDGLRDAFDPKMKR